MDYNLRETPILTTKDVLSISNQQSIDLDFTLPDYCADIEKILKCSMKVKIFTKNLSSGQLRVEGTTVITVLYTDAGKKALRCCEQSEPFTATIPINQEVGEHIIDITPKPEYINCRALTQRRLTVHGAFSLNIKVSERKLLHLFTDDTASDLQTKLKKVSLAETKIFTEDRLSISEAVTFSHQKPVETLVMSKLSCNLAEHSLSKDRLTLKGDLILRLLYITDASTGEVDHYVCSVPFTEVVSVTDEICDITCVNVNVDTFDVTLKTEAVTSEPVIHLEASLCVSVSGYREKETEYICDAYSTDYDTTLSSDIVPILTKVSPISVSFSEKTDISLGEKSIVKILDIFYDTPHFKGELSDSTAEFSGKADISILAATADDELICIDRQVNLNHSHVVGEGFTDISRVKGEISTLSYRLGDANNMELRVDVKLESVLCTKENLNTVSSVCTVSDTKKENPHSPLTLYFADEGESMWDISKRYSTCLGTVLEENCITDDELKSPQMIMIFRT